MDTNRTQTVKCKKKTLVINFPDAKDKPETEFYRYTVKRNGKVYLKNGKEVSRINLSGPGSHINLYVGERKYKFDLARLIYNLFSGEELLTTKDIILYKDGDKNNKAFDNLLRTEKKNFYVPTKIREKKIDKETAKKIKAEYNEGTKNGTLMRRKCYEGEIPSYRSLAEKYNCSTYVINMIMQDRYY